MRLSNFCAPKWAILSEGFQVNVKCKLRTGQTKSNRLSPQSPCHQLPQADDSFAKLS